MQRNTRVNWSLPADQAVKVVKSGDWIDYGEFCGQVRDLDQALAKER